MIERALDKGWTLRAAPGPLAPAELVGRAVPATVPGCVHTDLLAAGLIPDPYLDDNERKLAWIGRTGWVYETTFAWDGGGEDRDGGDRDGGDRDGGDWDGGGDRDGGGGAGAGRVDLVCAGLDTVATISLNGQPVGRTANMHRGYRFAVRDLLRAGDNTLRVEFEPAYEYAERERDRLGDRPNAYPEPFNFIRKMACNFGWDWGPTLVTAGIWRGIGLESWYTARLAQVRPLVTVTDGVGRVEAHITVERSSDEPLTVVATVAGQRAEATIAPGERTAVVTLAVADPDLWWPRGYGDQPRYPLDVSLRDAAGTELHTWHRRIGFRSVSLDTTPDEHGTPFALVVNDVPVFVRGVNWIPDDAFVTRVDRDRYARRLGQACEANVNLLRVWGGGRYESEDFYELADSLGLMVAQDFLFACAAYPEEEPFAAEVAAEAAEQVVRLAPYPSLVLWTGNNENIWGFHDWDWQEPLAGRSWGAGYYFELLPDIVRRLDPTRPYWPGSPWSGSPEVHPNDPAHGTTHIWDVWNTDDYVKYREYVPRFLAEFGYQAPPGYATLRRALRDEPLAHDSPGMAHHQKAIDGDRKLRRGLDAHLPEPVDFEDWHYLTQVNQARAIALGVEHFRSHRPVCMGTVVWQLNDCWPVTSWSAIDGDGRRKPLWYALRRSYADRLLTVQPRGDGLALVAVNETGRPWRASVTVTRLNLTGVPQAKTALELDVPAYRAQELALPADLARPDDARRELLLARVRPEPQGPSGPAVTDEAGRAFWFFAEDRDIVYPRARFDATVEPFDGGQRVHVTAVTILRDLTLYADRLDPAAEVDLALVTLLPGETATFTVRSAAQLDPAALTSRPVLRCVNDITCEGG